MPATRTTAEKMLMKMRREIAGASSLFSGRLRDEDESSGKTGFSDLYAHECAGDFPEAADYRLSVEYMFEGYLLHYRRSRLLKDDGTDFSLLAGDYMYARGLSAIVGLEDLASIAAFADLLQLCAYVDCESLDRTLSMNAWIVTVISLARHTSGAGGDFVRLSDLVWGNGGGESALPELMDGLVQTQSEAGEERQAALSGILLDIDTFFRTGA